MLKGLIAKFKQMFNRKPVSKPVQVKQYSALLQYKQPGRSRWKGKPGQRKFTNEERTGEVRLYPDTAEGRALREERRKERNRRKREARRLK